MEAVYTSIKASVDLVYLLPIGVQVVGPYLHDITTIRAARLISKLCGGPPRPELAL